MKNLAIFSSLLFIVYLSTGCHKTDTTKPATTTADSGKIYLHLHTNLDTNEADIGNVYTMSDGRKVSLGAAQMLISNIQMVKQDGSLQPIPGVVILKTVDEEVYYAGKVPTGSYKAIKFSVGLDATTDTKTTTDSNLTNTSMWFGSALSAGHMFIDFEGAIDTTAAATATTAQLQPFMYHIGTNARYTSVQLPDRSDVYSVGKDSTQFVHVIIDYYKLFKNVPLNNAANLMIHTASDNGASIGTTIGGNIPGMFSYEE